MYQKKTAYLGVFAAVAIIFGYVESLFPFFAGIPGIKLGLANLAVLFILEKYSYCKLFYTYHYIVLFVLETHRIFHIHYEQKYNPCNLRNLSL